MPVSADRLLAASAAVTLAAAGYLGSVVIPGWFLYGLAGLAVDVVAAAVVLVVLGRYLDDVFSGRR